MHAPGPPPERPATEPLTTVLLPGLDGTGRLFRRFLDIASGRLDLRVISYPQRPDYGYAELAGLVAGQLPTDRPFALLGESFAGPLALRVACLAPRGLTAVVLVSTFLHHPLPARWRRWRFLVRRPPVFAIPLPAFAVRLVLAGRDAPPDLVAEVQTSVVTVPPDAMSARSRAALDVDARDDLRRCPVPILFLGAGRDWLLRTDVADEVKQIRPDAEIRTLPGPHLLMQRYPRESMDMVENFVLGRARTAARAAGGG